MIIYKDILSGELDGTEHAGVSSLWRREQKTAKDGKERRRRASKTKAIGI